MNSMMQQNKQSSKWKLLKTDSTRIPNLASLNKIPQKFHSLVYCLTFEFKSHCFTISFDDIIMVYFFHPLHKAILKELLILPK